MNYIVHPSCQIPGIAEIFDEYFGDTGTFVEVGAFDGMTYGCTWGLAEAGWKGLYIEPHPDFARQCITNHATHPNITTVCTACGNRNGFTFLTIYGECSTTKLDKWNKEWGMDENTPKIEVPIKRLDDVLDDENILTGFDLLVIDVEGSEREVLEGFSLQFFRPKMVIIELHEGLGTMPYQKGYQTPWVDNYMMGYEKIYSDKINSIYVLRSESRG